MAFRDFSFPQVKQELGLEFQDRDMFGGIADVELPPAFMETIAYGSELANAIATEKAKSEFIIAPVLLELRRELKGKFKLFSGHEWSVDPSRGLNGYCDFILTKGSTQYILDAPFIAIAEAKNDSIQTGLGQCIAGMYAAKLSNDKAKIAIPTVYGVVSTGGDWKFLKLEGSMVTIDEPIYFVSNLPKIMGILKHIVLSVEI